MEGCCVCFDAKDLYFNRDRQETFTDYSSQVKELGGTVSSFVNKSVSLLEIDLYAFNSLYF
jgi:hypothetical protein